MNIRTKLENELAEHKRAADRLTIALAELDRLEGGAPHKPQTNGLHFERHKGKRAPKGYVQDAIISVVKARGPLMPQGILNALKEAGYPYPVDEKRIWREVPLLKKAKRLTRTPKGWSVA